MVSAKKQIFPYYMSLIWELETSEPHDLYIFFRMAKVAIGKKCVL